MTEYHGDLRRCRSTPVFNSTYHLAIRETGSRFENGFCLRTETATNDVTDYGVGKAVENLAELRDKLSSICDNYHDAQSQSGQPFLAAGQQIMGSQRVGEFLESGRITAAQKCIGALLESDSNSGSRWLSKIHSAGHGAGSQGVPCLANESLGGSGGTSEKT